MKFEILLSIIDKKENSEIYNHLKEKNITSDVIIVNQTNFDSVSKNYINGKNVNILNLNERGVGLSRNSALQKTKADVVLFADDDEKFEDGYEFKIIDAFKKLPDADIILFNVKSNNPNRPTAEIKKIKKVHWYNSMKYGAYQIAIKVNSVKKNYITFSTLFGGGSKFGSGEDSLFLLDALDAGLNIYTSPSQIATVEQKSSTWFKGYDKKFFFDRGALFSAAFKFPKIIAFIQVFRKKNVYLSKLNLYQQYKYLCLGIECFNKKYKISKDDKK